MKLTTFNQTLLNCLNYNKNILAWWDNLEAKEQYRLKEYYFSFKSIGELTDKNIVFIYECVKFPFEDPHKK